MKIDIHAHMIPLDCFDPAEVKDGPYGRTIIHEPSGEEVLVTYGMRLDPPVACQMYDPRRRIQDMDRMGVDIQAISISPNFHYSADPALALRLTQKENDEIAGVVKAYPDRFVGMATLALQDMNGAIRELGRAVHELGMRAVQIGSNINGKNLGEPELWPFYEKVQALEIPIFIHPNDVAGAARLQKHFLTNLIGNPLDTSIAIASLIFNGVLEKFPGLKFVFSHAGGMIPYTGGRLDRGYKVVPECGEAIPKPPTEYLKLMYFDTIAHSTPALAYLINTAGPERVVLATDYPYPMGDPDPVASIQNVPGLSLSGREKIMGKVAAKLLKL